MELGDYSVCAGVRACLRSGRFWGLKATLSPPAPAPPTLKSSIFPHQPAVSKPLRNFLPARCAPEDLAKERGPVLEEWRLTRNSAGRMQARRGRRMVGGTQLSSQHGIGRAQPVTSACGQERSRGTPMRRQSRAPFNFEPHARLSPDALPSAGSPLAAHFARQQVRRAAARHGEPPLLPRPCPRSFPPSPAPAPAPARPAGGLPPPLPRGAL